MSQARFIGSYLWFSVFIGLTPFFIISPLQGSEWLYNYLIDRVYTLSYSISPFQGYWVGNQFLTYEAYFLLGHSVMAKVGHKLRLRLVGKGEK